MRICIFSTTFFPNIGGAERFMHGLATHLSNMGIEVFVLVPVSPQLKRFESNYKLLKLKGLGIFSKSSILFEIVLFLNLLIYQIKFKFDVIQAVVLYPPAFVAAKLKKIFPVSVVARPTGEDIQIYPEIAYGLRLNPKIDKKIRWTIKNVDGLVANSKTIKEKAVKLGCRKDKTFIIGNGVDIERFKNPQSNIKKRFNLPSEAKILLSVGRPHPKKDYPTLIKAFSLISKKRGDIYLVIIGGGTDVLKPVLKNLKIEDRVVLTGALPRTLPLKEETTYTNYPVEEVIDIYLASDIFVFASLIEGQPNVLLEALAAGLPVVTTDAPGNRDVVGNGQTGFLVPIQDPQEMANKVLKLLNDPDLYQRFSKSARLESKKFAWIKIIKEYLNVYKKI